MASAAVNDRQSRLQEFGRQIAIAEMSSGKSWEQRTLPKNRYWANARDEATYAMRRAFVLGGVEPELIEAAKAFPAGVSVTAEPKSWRVEAIPHPLGRAIIDAAVEAQTIRAFMHEVIYGGDVSPVLGGSDADLATDILTATTHLETALEMAATDEDEAVLVLKVEAWAHRQQRWAAVMGEASAHIQALEAAGHEVASYLLELRGPRRQQDVSEQAVAVAAAYTEIEHLAQQRLHHLYKANDRDEGVAWRKSSDNKLAGKTATAYEQIGLEILSAKSHKSVARVTSQMQRALAEVGIQPSVVTAIQEARASYFSDVSPENRGQAERDVRQAATKAAVEVETVRRSVVGSLFADQPPVFFTRPDLMRRLAKPDRFLPALAELGRCSDRELGNEYSKVKPAWSDHTERMYRALSEAKTVVDRVNEQNRPGTEMLEALSVDAKGLSAADGVASVGHVL